MNWRQLNEKYPAAVREYLRSEDIINEESKAIWFTSKDADDNTYFFKTDAGESFCVDADEAPRMPHYFDGLGIVVNSFYITCPPWDKYGCQIGIKGPYTSVDYLPELDNNKPSIVYGPSKRRIQIFSNPLTALQAGIEKAFEIREGQLKQIKE